MFAPVCRRDDTLASDGKTIVYEENFGLWKLDLTNGGEPKEIKVSIASDEKENNLEKS